MNGRLVKLPTLHAWYGHQKLIVISVVAIVTLTAFSCTHHQPGIVTRTAASAATVSRPVKQPSWPLPEPFKVTSRDIRHGEQQVERMVRDRPAMARNVNRSSPLWRWSIRQFAGVSLGQRIYWNKDDPIAASDGSNSELPDSGQPACIHVSKTSRDPNGSTFHSASSEELWERAVFELNNLSSATKFEAVNRDALMGKLTKESWIEKNTRIEYLTGLKTAQVYEHLWSNRKTANQSSQVNWGRNLPDTYEEWIGLYTDHSGYPWDYWGKYYDDQIVPYLKSNATMK